MKTKKKLIVGIIALCLSLVATVGVVTAVLAAQNATATATFTISYTATAQVNASVGASYGKLTYGISGSSAGFTAMTENGVSTITTPHRFYPTSSSSNLDFDAVTLGQIQAYEYLVVKYVFTNHSTNMGIMLNLSINQTATINDHNPFDLKYYLTSSDLTFTSSENGTISAPNLISLGNINEYSFSGNLGYGETCYIYLVFTLNNPDLYGGTLNSIRWTMSKSHEPT